MKVKFGDKTHTFERDLKVRDLLKELKLNPEEVIVIRNGEVVTEDEVVRVGDEIEIVRVISGG